MTPSQQALAPRLSTTLDTVQDILGTLVSRYRTDEVLTSVQQIPAREAEFRPMSWLRHTGRKGSKNCIRTRLLQPSSYTAARTLS